MNINILKKETNNRRLMLNCFLTISFIISFFCGCSSHRYIIIDGEVNQNFLLEDNVKFVSSRYFRESIYKGLNIDSAKLMDISITKWSWKHTEVVWYDTLVVEHN